MHLLSDPLSGDSHITRYSPAHAYRPPNNHGSREPGNSNNISPIKAGLHLLRAVLSSKKTQARSRVYRRDYGRHPSTPEIQGQQGGEKIPSPPERGLSSPPQTRRLSSRHLLERMRPACPSMDSPVRLRCADFPVGIRSACVPPATIREPVRTATVRERSH